MEVTSRHEERQGVYVALWKVRDPEEWAVEGVGFGPSYRNCEGYILTILGFIV